MNKVILEKLKKQASCFSTLKFHYGDDVEFLDWANETKLLILFLSFDKKDEYLRKELIAMLESYVKKMPVHELIEFPDTLKKIKKTGKELQGLVKLMTEILELKENNLGEKESVQ